MPDGGSINVKITADASGFTTGVNQINTASNTLATRLAMAQSEFRAASGEARKLADELREAGGSDAGLSAALANAAGAAAQARQEIRELSHELRESHASPLVASIESVNQ